MPASGFEKETKTPPELSRPKIAYCVNGSESGMSERSSAESGFG